MKIIIGIAVGVLIALLVDSVLLFVSRQNTFASLAGVFGGSIVGGFMARERSWIVGLGIGIVSQAAESVILTVVGFGAGIRGGLSMGLALYAVGVENALTAIIAALIGSSMGAKIIKSHRQVV